MRKVKTEYLITKIPKLVQHSVRPLFSTTRIGLGSKVESYLPTPLPYPKHVHKLNPSLKVLDCGSGYTGMVICVSMTCEDGTSSNETAIYFPH